MAASLAPGKTIIDNSKPATVTLRTRTVPLAASVPGVTNRSLLVTFTVAL